MACSHSFSGLSSIPWCIYVPHLYPSLCWWTLRLLPRLGCCKQHCYEHWGVCVFLNLKFCVAMCPGGKNSFERPFSSGIFSEKKSLNSLFQRKSWIFYLMVLYSSPLFCIQFPLLLILIGLLLLLFLHYKSEALGQAPSLLLIQLSHHFRQNMFFNSTDLGLKSISYSTLMCVF